MNGLWKSALHIQTPNLTLHQRMRNIRMTLGFVSPQVNRFSFIAIIIHHHTLLFS
jgi:hypothetical protein